jgi:GMP synthase-like glutamine amidotransferase
MKNINSPIKVGILQCDEIMEKLQPQFGVNKDMIQQMFADVPEPLEFDVFDCLKQEYPEDIDQYDFYITTGSRYSVYEKEPWILRLIDFVKELDRQKIKLIGICFGHQIIGMVYHGKVENSVKGWGIGVAENRIISAPSWMTEGNDKLNILVSHQDQVTMLPEGAVVIAESDFCPYFVVQWSEHFLSIQGHPEWKKEYSRALMNARRGIIPAKRIEEGLATLDLGVDNKMFVRWIMDFVSK